MGFDGIGNRPGIVRGHVKGVMVLNRDPMPEVLSSCLDPPESSPDSSCLLFGPLVTLPQFRVDTRIIEA